MQYDTSTGVISRVFTSASQLPPRGAWPLLANGSVGVEPAAANGVGMAASRVVLVDPEQRSGVSLGFDPCEVTLAVGGEPLEQSFASPSASRPLSVSLDTGRGVLTLSCGTVSHQLRALMHSPTLMLHTITVNGLPASGTLRVSHRTRAPLSAIGAEPDFRGDTLAVGDSSSLFVFTATSGPVSCSSCFLLGTAGLAALAAAPAYLVDPEIIGEPRSATAVVELSCGALGGSVTLHVLSSMQRDAPPSAGIALLRMTAVASGLANMASTLVALHEASWAERWTTSVDVAFASDSPPPYANRLRRCLRYAAWNLHSCARRDGRGVLDVSGAVVLQGRQDDFLVNGLLLINTGGARVAIEARRGELANGAVTARLAGMQGASVDRDGAPSLRATSELAIDTWNYFRVSGDTAWLSDTGISILRSTADYISDPRHTWPVPSLAVDVAAAIAALRCATEACYALSQSPRDAWSTARYALAAQLAVGPALSLPAGVIGGTGSASTPEPLQVLAQPLLTLADDTGVTLSQLSANLAYWGSTSRSVAGDMVLLQSRAQAAQQTGTYADAAAFEQDLVAVLQRCDDSSGWGNLSNGGSGVPNNPSLSAQLVAAVIQGLAGAMVQGGYTQGGNEYASTGINAASSAALPESWERLLINGLGSKGDVVMLNAASETGMTSTGSQLSPWRFNSLLLIL